MTAELIAAIAAQEERLVFERFDADLALAIGLDIRARVAAAGQGGGGGRALLGPAALLVRHAGDDDGQRGLGAAEGQCGQAVPQEHLPAGAGAREDRAALPAECGPEAVADCVLAGGGFPLQAAGRRLRRGGDGLRAAGAAGPRDGGGGAGGGAGGRPAGAGAAGVTLGGAARGGRRGPFGPRAARGQARDPPASRPSGVHRAAAGGAGFSNGRADGVLAFGVGGWGRS